MHHHSLLAVLVLSLTAFQSLVAAEGDELFLKRVYTNATGARLPYRLLLPKTPDSQPPLPVVVFLHGAIARGTDNEEALNWGPRLIQKTVEGLQTPCVIVVPQCPKGVSWSSAAAGGEPDALSLVVKWVEEELPKECRVDPRRRYLTGVSMGGIALWSYICKHPGFFAAAVPVCAAGEPSDAARATGLIPVWAFHSDDDHLIPVQSARDMVRAWQSHGGEAKYTEYTGLKHSSWKKAYLEPELFPWLFRQSLPLTPKT